MQLYEYNAFELSELLGSKVSPELIREIKQEVMGFDGVRGVFDIILHNYGPDAGKGC